MQRKSFYDTWILHEFYFQILVESKPIEICGSVFIGPRFCSSEYLVSYWLQISSPPMLIRSSFLSLISLFWTRCLWPRQRWCLELMVVTFCVSSVLLPVCWDIEHMRPWVMKQPFEEKLKIPPPCGKGEQDWLKLQKKKKSQFCVTSQPSGHLGLCHGKAGAGEAAWCDHREPSSDLPAGQSCQCQAPSAPAQGLHGQAGKSS